MFGKDTIASFENLKPTTEAIRLNIYYGKSIDSNKRLKLNY